MDAQEISLNLDHTQHRPHCLEVGPGGQLLAQVAALGEADVVEFLQIALKGDFAFHVAAVGDERAWW